MAIFTVNTASPDTDPDDGVLTLFEAITAARDNADTDDIIRFSQGLENVAMYRSFLNLQEGHSLLIDGDTDGDGVSDINLVSSQDDGYMPAFLFRISGTGQIEFRNLGFDGLDVQPLNTGIARGLDGMTGQNRSLSGTDAASFSPSVAVLKVADADVTLTRVTFSDIEVGDLDGNYAENVRGGDGASPPDGLDGSDGRRSIDGSNGSIGSGGGSGGDATPDRADAAPIIIDGGELTLRDVAFTGDARAVSMAGGRGGDGAAGSDGGDGGDGGDSSVIPGPGDGGDGGDGGRGGNGGDGGDAGWASNGVILKDGAVLNDLTAIAYSDAAFANTVGASGGRAGAGGAGGKGGAGGSGGEGFLFFSDGENGSSGDDGSDGNPGNAGVGSVTSPFGLVESEPGVFDSIGIESTNTLFYVAQDAISEEEGGSVSISVIRVGETDFDVEVPWELQGPGTDVVDGAVSGVLQFFANGSKVQRVTLETLNDNTLGTDETFTFVLGTPVGGSEASNFENTVQLGTTETLVTIEDLTTATNGDDIFEGSEVGDFLDLLGGNDRFDARGGNDTLVGGAGNDTLRGGDQFDTIRGGEGNDSLFGGYGRDLAFGGNGNDRFIGSTQAGVNGQDTVFGGNGNDTLLARGGNDEVHGNAGNDSIEGGDGNDRLFGGINYDTIRGGNGNDTVFGGDGRDLIFLGNGNDRFNDNGQGGVNGQDTVFGGNGNDTLLAKGGNDVIHGNQGNDSIEGGDGNDRLFGGDQFDTIRGGNGNDTVWGGNGRDLIYLGTGNDVFNDNGQGGDLGRDTVFGYGGNDTLNGGGGNDNLNGNQGNDRIFGGNGNDRIFGGLDNDTMTGGAGVDTFVYNGGADIVTDFGNGADQLQIDDALWNGTTLSPTQVVNQFADDSSGTVIFDFGGGNTLTLTGVSSTNGLDDILTIV